MTPKEKLIEHLKAAFASLEKAESICLEESQKPDLEQTLNVTIRKDFYQIQDDLENLLDDLGENNETR